MLCHERAVTHHVTAATLAFQTNPMGDELSSHSFSYKRFLLFQEVCVNASHVSENALYQKISVSSVCNETQIMYYKRNNTTT